MASEKYMLLPEALVLPALVPTVSLLKPRACALTAAAVRAEGEEPDGTDGRAAAAVTCYLRGGGGVGCGEGAGMGVWW
jgi:hypothetical protein